MTAEPFTLTAEPEHKSISARVPHGWTKERRKAIDGTPYCNARDTQGFLWVWIDGEWMLYVPWFRDMGTGDQWAVLDLRGEDRCAPVLRDGSIKIGRRRISPKKWHH